MLQNNWIALAITFGSAMIWLRANDFIAHRGWMSGRLSRKIIHIGTGPIFVLCWLLFNDRLDGRYLAALVPFAITVQFVLIGLGIIHDPAAVAAMSRTGDRKEILRGPLFYGICFVIVTVLFWKESPVGMVALMMMCGGDGLADLVGRKVRSPKLPWSPKKSVAGTIAVYAGGLAFSLLVLAVHIEYGQLSGNLMDYIIPVSMIGIAATLAESLPMADIDNLTVTATAVVFGVILF